MDIVGAVLLVALCVAPTPGEDALAPRNNGDCNHENSPVPTYRQNCHPAMSICQLPRRGITKKESEMNQRALSGDQLGTPTRPIIPQEFHPFGPQIARESSLESLSLRSGPAIKDCSSVFVPNQFNSSH
jgi:hypothetical protein